GFAVDAVELLDQGAVLILALVGGLYGGQVQFTEFLQFTGRAHHHDVFVTQQEVQVVKRQDRLPHGTERSGFLNVVVHVRVGNLAQDGRQADRPCQGFHDERQTVVKL